MDAAFAIVFWPASRRVWRVRYNDGYLSTAMTKRTARSYAKMFGGGIERAPKGWPDAR